MPRPLQILPDRVWMHALAAGTPVPREIRDSAFINITRTSEGEVVVICDRQELAGASRTIGPYRLICLEEPVGVEVSGVVAGVSRPLAEAGISIFAVSTVDRCYTLVAAERLEEAVDALVLAGFPVTRP